MSNAATWIQSIALVCLLAFVSVLNGQEPAAVGPRQIDIPITRAALFSSGVGYFEHAGVVDGDAQLQLLFKPGQINDVLKSMVVLDLDGGVVRRVNYPSNDPIDRALGTFSVNLSGYPSMSELLRQLRGARLTVRAPEPIVGSILNVESSVRVVGEPEAQVTEHTLFLVTDAGIRSIPFASISTLQFDEPRLQDELDRALALLASSRDTERKPMRVLFQGQGRRRVRVGYVVESPIWKTSYRIDLTAREDEPQTQGKVLLQGWAIVENTSDSDWQNLQLSLVSGQPISFVQDLSTPLYMPRPEVMPELFAFIDPQKYRAGMERQNELNKRSRRPRSDSGGGGLFGASEEDDMPTVRRLDEFELRKGFASVASTAQVGELFAYTIDHPVTLPRRESAMLPIVNQHVQAERVSIYNPDVHEEHPLNGIYLTNDTGLNLPGGPITVLDGGSYAGDAQIDHLPPEGKRLLSYAVDLAVRVSFEQDHSFSDQELEIKGQAIILKRVRSLSSRYTIVNSAPADRSIIIEVRKDMNADVVGPIEPLEETSSHVRFRVSAQASRTTLFEVRHVSREDRYYNMVQSDFDLKILLDRAAEPKIRQLLEHAISYHAQLAQLKEEQKKLQAQIDMILQDQPRVRENIKTVGADTAQGKRYLNQLNEQEDQLLQLRQNFDDLQQQIEQKTQALIAEIKKHQKPEEPQVDDDDA